MTGPACIAYLWFQAAAVRTLALSGERQAQREAEYLQVQNDTKNFYFVVIDVPVK